MNRSASVYNSLKSRLYDIVMNIAHVSFFSRCHRHGHLSTQPAVTNGVDRARHLKIG